MTEFREGDEVIDCITEKVSIIDIDNSPATEFPLHAGTEWYRSNGAHASDNEGDKPRLFHLKGFVNAYSPEPKRLPDLAMDAPMLVSCDGVTYVHRHFKWWNKEGCPLCFNDGRTSYTSGDNGALTSWSYWKLPDEV